MNRVRGLVCLGLLVCASAMPAADHSLAGSWKLQLLTQGQRPVVCLIDLRQEGGKWSGTAPAAAEQFGKPTISDVTVTPELVRFTLNVQGRRFRFEGRPQQGGKRIPGSINLGHELAVAELERTSLRKVDPYDISKEVIATQPDGPDVVESALWLLGQAGQHQATPEELQRWAERAFRCAAPFGPRYQRETALRLAAALAPLPAGGALAVDQARRAERLVSAQDGNAVEKLTLQTLASVLRQAGKEAEARAVEDREKKIEWVRATPHPGRQGQGRRTVLVELFTGAECPPCVAADVAFDALGQTYPTSDVMLLEYHLHIPGPDPLTGPAAEARQKYYGDAVGGTPSLFFNGHADSGGGGRLSDGQDRYEDFVAAINPLLEGPARLRLNLQTVRKGDRVEMTAEASGVPAALDRARLRLALVEEQVDYRGSNGLPTYQHVVRALPGGALGAAIKDGQGKLTATVDLADLRRELTKYLDDYAREAPFRNKSRPLELKDLRVVAFVQDDGTHEVLQTTQAELHVPPER